MTNYSRRKFLKHLGFTPVAVAIPKWLPASKTPTETWTRDEKSRHWESNTGRTFSDEDIVMWVPFGSTVDIQACDSLTVTYEGEDLYFNPGEVYGTFSEVGVDRDGLPKVIR